MYIKKFFRDYSLLFVSPLALEKCNNRSIQHGIWYVIHSLWFGIILGVVFSLTAISVGEALGYDANENNLLSDFIQNNSFLTVLLLSSVTAPITEEVSFRLFLDRNRYVFAIGLLLLNVFVLSVIGLSLILIPLVVLTIPFALSALLLSKDSFLTSIYERLFPLWVWGSTILFSLMHLANYTNLEQIGPLALLFVITQLISGSLYVFLRIRFGFWYCFASHALFNGIVITYINFFGQIQL